MSTTPETPEVETEPVAAPDDSETEEESGEAESGQGSADTPGESPLPQAEPEPEQAVEVPGKLVFACRECGVLNDLMRPDALVTEPRQHERYRTCAGCGGLGQVDTGSVVPGRGTIPCPDCGGAGYQDTSRPGEPPAEDGPQGEPPWLGAVWNPETKGWT